jgi:hypothetical protein
MSSPRSLFNYKIIVKTKHSDYPLDVSLEPSFAELLTRMTVGMRKAAMRDAQKFWEELYEDFCFNEIYRMHGNGD